MLTLNSRQNKLGMFGMAVFTRWAAYLIICLLAATAFEANSQTNNPFISLFSEPLYQDPSVDKPALVLALSVEWPTVGAQYTGTAGANTDDSYDNKITYLGYFNAEKCYGYWGSAAPNYRRFSIVADATAHTCTDGFSGNFLNWATSSAIDILRLAITGGDRFIDEEYMTILQRAVLPRGLRCMWNSPFFPAKKLSFAGGTSGKPYFGAIPGQMINAARRRNIWVGNTGDRFSMVAAEHPSGNCDNYDDYTLGSRLRADPKFFYARVEVCATDTNGNLVDTRDYNLCTKYPNGNYKPTGVAQKYSDRLRLAAFSYLLENTNSQGGGRYGGVLRVPMKYIGLKTFDAVGKDNTPTGGNPKMEWDSNTGILRVNPDGSNIGVSGFINYVNLFGRSGRYKDFDPVGELHYEALRYLQGLQPSPAAIINLNDNNRDGFPVITEWADPYADRPETNDYSCLKSNIALIGDTIIHDGNRLPKADADNNIPDIDQWRTTVEHFEKKRRAPYIDGQGQQRYTEKPGSANEQFPTNNIINQIIGTAYWAHTHDIRGNDWRNANGRRRPGLRVKTLIFDVNQRGEQNDRDRRWLANPLFQAAKYGGFETDPDSDRPYNTWGNPFYTEDGHPDDSVWSRNGEARSYARQSESRKVLSAFDSMFNQASKSERSTAGGAIASQTLTRAGTTTYQASFTRSDWGGDLQAFRISVDDKHLVTVATTPNWSAERQLRAREKPASSRNIIVGNTGATANPVAAPFTWQGISTSLRTDLNRPSPGTPEDGLGKDRLNYLRGDDSHEGNLFRTREKLLGDIINSGVAYSGAPSTSLSSNSYQDFFTANKTRAPAVFVGANDGMLHAFNAINGDELFAYIPSWLGPKLSALTSTTYGTRHQSYVDATPVVGEAQTGSTGTADDWKTVLVSGTGAGGRGVFALDVTNPAQFTAANAMWEFTNSDDPDMGNVVGKPQILKFRTSAPDARTSTFKWFAVVGSGVYSHPSSRKREKNISGTPALFLLDLSKSVGQRWARNQNYYKIVLPADSALSTQKAPGLVNFNSTLGLSREVKQIYMGDLQGKLWKLDFSNFGTRDWNFNKLSAFKNSAGHPIPLFITKDASGNVQPITMAPSLAYGPTPVSTYVLIGTGKYMELSDASSKAKQSFYMLYDDGSSTADARTMHRGDETAIISGRSRLREGSATEAGIISNKGTISVPEFSLGRATSDNDHNQRSGWYFDFPTPGERAVGEAKIYGTQITFSTLNPDPPISLGDCSAPAGSGSQYVLDVSSGAGTSSKSFVELLGEPLVFELSDTTAYSSSDNTGRRIKTVTGKIIQQGSSGLKPGDPITKTVVTGRLSWRQINNYQDLKNAP